MTDLDNDSDETWEFPRSRERGAQPREVPCDHTTCAGCATCPCHRKPKPERPRVTPSEAITEGVRLKQALRRVIVTLDAITNVEKERPRSQLEEAVIRGHADIDNAMRSPTLNGAVAGGDDPSFRILDQHLDENSGNWQERADAIALNLRIATSNVAELERAAKAAFTAVLDLQGITETEAQKLLEAASQVQSCVHCGRVVTGTRDDRLRAGRCKPCYEYRLEHHGQERPQYLIDRELRVETEQGT